MIDDETVFEKGQSFFLCCFYWERIKEITCTMVTYKLRLY